MKYRIISICLIVIMCILMISGTSIYAKESTATEEEVMIQDAEDDKEIESQETDSEGESFEGESAEGEVANSDGEPGVMQDTNDSSGEAGEMEIANSSGTAVAEPETDENGDFIFEEDPDSEGQSSDGEAEAAASEEGESEGEKAEEADGKPEPVQAFIIVRGFEWGPGVNKVVLELDAPVDAILTEKIVRCSTLFWSRRVEEIFLSNRMGYEVEGPSKYITFVLETTYEQSGSPFIYDLMDTEHNFWAKEYNVSASCSVEKDGEMYKIRFEGDCIGNHFSPDIVAFNRQGVFSGKYFNVMNFKSEPLSINYAICEPTNIAGGEKNPLIIWLHGRGEGGDDIEITLLGYEVSALTEKEIQSHFISGDQTGAYILVPQVPTYWRDAGDSVEHEGDMPSRYRQILMDLITAYMEENDDIDPNRIYIMGASNGGFMTFEMIENYPDFFAAAVPVSPAVAYNVYAREDDGDYRSVQGEHVETGDIYLTEEKIELIKQTPIWIIGCATDNITPVLQYSAPTYWALIKGGAENCWCTMYQNVMGTESSNTKYLGHYAWIYLFNDQIEYVQDPEPVAEADEDTFYYGLSPSKNGGSMQVPDGNGGVYENIFDWMNAQTLTD